MARLHSRIYLHSLVTVLVVGIVTTAVFVVGARGAFQREIAERMTRHVASLVAERFTDPPALAQRLAQLRADVGVDVTVRDLQNRSSR